MLHRRSIFLINRRFQLRFAFYVCSWLIALSLAYPLIISNVFEYFIRYLAADPMGPGLATLEKTREDLFLLLSVMQLVLLSLAFLISIFMSHKIAGPLYKLNRFLREARDGNIQQKLSFRRKDYFQELVPTYNEMMDSVRARLEKKDEGIQLAIQSFEKILATSGSHSQSEIQQVLVKLRESQK